jgi:hypothetical protein
MIQFPKRFRGGTNPISWEQPTIFRDPPRSIHTRKKERIAEGDVTHFIREDDSRINENIANYAKGVNPMVEIDYQNRAYNTTNTIKIAQSTNPYKVNKAFRPPLFRLEDLLPISRQRHPETTVTTNPGIPDSFVDCDLADKYDRQSIDHITTVTKAGGYIPPTTVYKIEYPQEVNVRNAIHDTILKSHFTSLPGYKISQDAETFSQVTKEASKENIMKDIGINSAVSASIDVHPNNKSTPIKLKEYNYSSVQSNPNQHINVKPYNPNIELERNIPSHFSQSNVSDNSYYFDNVNRNQRELESQVLTSAQTNLSNRASGFLEERDANYKKLRRNDFGDRSEWDSDLRHTGGNMLIVGEHMDTTDFGTNPMLEVKRKAASMNQDRWDGYRGMAF